MTTEIADAVLTLRTDDAPLRAGLDRAERRIRDALRRMESAVNQTAANVDGDGGASVSTAVAALTGLSFALALTTTTSVIAAAAMPALAGAVGTLGVTSLSAAVQIRLAVSIIRRAADALMAQARAAALAAALATAKATAEATPPSFPIPPQPPLAAASGLPIAARSPALPARPNGPLVGALYVTVERENPRAIQAGVTLALTELAQRADLAGALD